MQFDLPTAQGKLNFPACGGFFEPFHSANSLQIADTMEICIKFPYAFVESERTNLAEPWWLEKGAGFMNCRKAIPVWGINLMAKKKGPSQVGGTNPRCKQGA